MNTKTVSDTAIIAAFWWPDSRADVACKLGTNADHVKRVWAKAKQDGAIPNLTRPPAGFNPRFAKYMTDLGQFALGKSASEHAGSSA